MEEELSNEINATKVTKGNFHGEWNTSTDEDIGDLMMKAINATPICYRGPYLTAIVDITAEDTNSKTTFGALDQRQQERSLPSNTPSSQVTRQLHHRQITATSYSQKPFISQSSPLTMPNTTQQTMFMHISPIIKTDYHGKFLPRTYESSS